MQDILRNYYAAGGKTLFESEEQSDSTIPDRARKIIATYSRQSGFKSPVEPDITKISGTPEQDLLAEIESQLVTGYTSDPKFASYLKKAMRLYVINLRKSDPVLANAMSFALSGDIPDPLKRKQDFISNLAKQDSIKYLTMYLQDTNLDHPVIAEQLTEVNVANLIKAAALAGSIAVGSQSLGATDVNTGDKPQATRQYSIVNQQANDIISRYHHTDAGNRSISGTLAPHNILDNTPEGKLLSDIRAQMNQRWNPENDPELKWDLYNYVDKQGLVYFVYHLLDTNPEHPFVSDIKEY